MNLENELTSEEILEVAEVLRARTKAGYDWRKDVFNLHNGRIDSYDLECILPSVRRVRNNLTGDPEIFAGVVE